MTYKVIMTCKVDYTYITQLKLQNEEMVILHCKLSPECQCSAVYITFLFLQF